MIYQDLLRRRTEEVADELADMIQALRLGPCTRKSRLFACGCCRQLWGLLDGQSRATVEMAERFADSNGTRTRLKSVRLRTMNAARTAAANDPSFNSVQEEAILATYWAVSNASNRTISSRASNRVSTALASAAAKEASQQATNNGANTATWSAIWSNAWNSAAGETTEVQIKYLLDVTGDTRQEYAVPRVDRTILALAHSAYDERPRPDGRLDPVRLHVLADALEEAGGTDERLVDHLRSPDPHIRGCWALDLILGRE